MCSHYGTKMTSALFSIALVFVSLVSATLPVDTPPPTSRGSHSASEKFTYPTGKLEYKLTEGDQRGNGPSKFF